MLSDYVGNGGDTNQDGTYTMGLTPLVKTDPRGANPRQHTGVIITQHKAWRDDGSLRNPLISTKQITDGTSHTLLIVEKYVPSNAYGGGAWGDNFGWQIGSPWEGTRYSNDPPLNDTPVFNNLSARGELPCDCDNFGSAHPGGFNATFCDGSGRSIPYDIDQDVLRRLTNRKDGQVVDANF
jgi:prepilin-type processing-associated H-X9-DG protein